MFREFGEFWLPPIFCITYMTMNKYYPVEPVNIHIQSFINIMQDNNRLITMKNGKGKLTLFLGNIKWVIPIYASWYSLHCVLYNSRTNMCLLPVHINYILWPILDLLIGHSIQSCAMTKIMVFKAWRHLFNFFVPDWIKSYDHIK